MDALEQSASEVLSLIRSVKNSFAPIGRIPPEVLSLIPDYWDTERHPDRDIIKLTHVCHGWREIFISRSSLWTRLDFMDVNKTLTYLQRSNSSPLDVHLKDTGRRTYLDRAFPLVIPHIHRLKSLIVDADTLPHILRHFRFRAPHLEELGINITSYPTQILDPALFDGDLSSLRELSLVGVTTSLPWRHMEKLRVLSLSGQEITVSQILDFLESSPLLETVEIGDSIPETSDAPPGRIVPLGNLKTLIITADPVHSILKHLDIPAGALLKVWASFGGDQSPLLEYLPEASPNLKNLSYITMTNLCFYPEAKCARLSGPSGGLRLFAPWEDEAIPSSMMDNRILRSLGPSTLSTTQRLTILNYTPRNPANDEECPVFRALSSANDLQTLILSECNNKPFIFALNPDKNPSKLVLCPNLKKIEFYARSWGFIKNLISMAKRRAAKGAKLPSITLTDLDSTAPGAEVLKLREHVTQVQHRVKMAPILWDYIPDPGDCGDILEELLA